MTGMFSAFLRSVTVAFLVSCGAAAAISPASAGAGDLRLASPIGRWLFQNNRFAIDIGPCGGRLCGKISWLKAPRDAAGLPRVDAANADAGLRARPVLGLTVLTGLRQTDDHTWEDGDIYNPEDGNHYNATMSVNEDGTLSVRAYAGMPFIGKTLNLSRIDEKLAAR
ncbi:MAG: DUF2147 domain-containing protein [Rhizomicrobium sp.]|jgi:uncharacterized protein (DUF2147 family)